MGTLSYCTQTVEEFGITEIHVPLDEMAMILPKAEPEYHVIDGECWQSIEGKFTIDNVTVWRKVRSS